MAARLAAVLLLAAAAAHAEDYLDREQFLAQAFAGTVPEQKTLWIDGAMRQRAQQVLGVAPANLRVRYWAAGGRSAWILEEIGKEQPITFGIVVEQRHIAALSVMAFRESRGGEIRHAFFTTQYTGAGLDGAGELDRSVDGITGATLSVRATSRAARLALWLDAQAESAVATR
jgi:hypothetical protein